MFHPQLASGFRQLPKRRKAAAAPQKYAPRPAAPLTTAMSKQSEVSTMGSGADQVQHDEAEGTGDQPFTSTPCAGARR